MLWVRVSFFLARISLAPFILYIMNAYHFSGNYFNNNLILYMSVILVAAAAACYLMYEGAGMGLI